MKIYLHMSGAEKELNERLVATLKQAGVLLVTNLEENFDADFSQKELKRLKLTGENLLLKMDGFVIEATNPDPEVGYLLAHAMSQHKPVLYLVKTGSKLGKHLQRLPDTVVIKEYTSESIVQELNDFLRHIEKGWGEEIANIKYTLRVSPLIDRYLTWKVKKKKVTKADFIRETLIRDYMDKDEEYQDYLSRR